jgi:carboxypeptidase C (cathepsin A)
MSHPARVVRLCLSGALLLAGAASIAQRPTPVPIPLATDGPLAPVTTAHRITLAGKPLAYHATWFETVLKDAAGVPQATISATAYVRDGVRDARARPVVVLFNGGPGASSSPLHFSALGPRTLGERDAAGHRALLDNPATLLDVADLIFIDPVGTGFSRPLRAGGGDAYWSVEGDAGAADRLMRDWLAANDRMASPLFLLGESYGGYRAGVMARHLADLRIAGLVLVSPALDFAPPSDQDAVAQLPTLAVAAWQHGKVAPDDRSVERVWEDARRFAQTDYLVALQQGTLLAPGERAAIATRMAALLGMPASAILAADLRPNSQTFLETLVPGSVVGRLDTRVSAPVQAKPVAPDRPAAANDPSLGLGRSNVIVSAPIGAYLREELQVPTTRDYFSLTLDVNFKWNWRSDADEPGASRSVVGNFATLLHDKPGVRLLVLGGYYDLAVPLLAPRYALTHGAIPPAQVQMVAFAAGHSVFEGAGNSERVSRVVHRFVEGLPAE